MICGWTYSSCSKSSSSVTVNNNLNSFLPFYNSNLKESEKINMSNKDSYFSDKEN